MTKSTTRKTTRRDNLPPEGKYLAAGSVGLATSEFEIAMIVFWHTFSRWVERCGQAAYSCWRGAAPQPRFATHERGPRLPAHSLDSPITVRENSSRVLGQARVSQGAENVELLHIGATVGLTGYSGSLWQSANYPVDDNNGSTDLGGGIGIGLHFQNCAPFGFTSFGTEATPIHHTDTIDYWPGFVQNQQ
ncbi:MAG: hypothetical protein JWO04_3210 [Gammaproteobacteria bacterium]|jgi:hypothetical protein|nr:hypothetical protein [Gammaproteobacteria bacterium]